MLYSVKLQGSSMFLNEEKGKDHRYWLMCLLVRILGTSLLHGAYSSKRSVFMEFCCGVWLPLIQKSLLISHSAAHDPPNRMFQYEPTVLITEPKSPRTTGGLCEKEKHCFPLHPIKTWMYYIKINQGHHYSFSVWFGFPSNYIPCIS